MHANACTHARTHTRTHTHTRARARAHTQTHPHMHTEDLGFEQSCVVICPIAALAVAESPNIRRAVPVASE